MNRLLLKIAAVAIAALPVAAQADWQAVRWGMLPDAVIAAGSGQIQATEEIKDQRILDNYRLATSRATVDGVDYILDYYFKPKDRKLALINYVPAKTDCDAAIASYTKRFGEGTGEVKSTAIKPGKPPIIQTKYSWADSARGDHIAGSDIAVVEYGIRYCQFLHSN